MGMLKINNLSLKGSGLGVHIASSSLPFKYVPPTLEELQAATDAALAEVAERLNWPSEQCLSAAAGRTGWPEGVEIDSLSAIIRLQDALAAEGDAQKQAVAGL